MALGCLANGTRQTQPLNRSTLGQGGYPVLEEGAAGGAVGVCCLEFEAPKRKHVGGTKLSKPVTVFLSSNIQVPPSPQLAERVKRANALGEIPPPGDQ